MALNAISFLVYFKPLPLPSQGLCCFTEHWADSGVWVSNLTIEYGKWASKWLEMHSQRHRIKKIGGGPILSHKTKVIVV